MHVRQDKSCPIDFRCDFCSVALQAIASSPQIAAQAGNQVVETEHLAKALLEQPNGIARRVISKAGGNPTAFLASTEDAIRRQPRVMGSVQQVGRQTGRRTPFVVSRASWAACSRWGDRQTDRRHSSSAARHGQHAAGGVTDRQIDRQTDRRTDVPISLNTSGQEGHSTNPIAFSEAPKALSVCACFLSLFGSVCSRS
jgi:ATP-dependent Clp protease ATP-binding subunit ClpA